MLAYELSSVPLSITYPNGDMRKTAKSILLKELEMGSNSATDITKDVNSKTCYIIYGYSTVSQLKKVIAKSLAIYVLN